MNARTGIGRGLLPPGVSPESIRLGSFGAMIAAGLLPLLSIQTVSAQPLSVGILDARYTTRVSANILSNGDSFPISRTNTWTSPCSDNLVVNGMSNISVADADLFGVQAQSSAFSVQSANASADSQIQFSPSADLAQTITIQFSSLRWYYCSGDVSLYDLTANAPVWDYSWNGFDGTVPWKPTGLSAVAQLNPLTDFLAAHEYELTMMTTTQSAGDSEMSQIQLTGLEAIPEPSTAALFSFAALGLLAHRRRK